MQNLCAMLMELKCRVSTSRLELAQAQLSGHFVQGLMPQSCVFAFDKGRLFCCLGGVAGGERVQEAAVHRADCPRVGSVPCTG